MGAPQFARRRDTKHNEIVEGLEHTGYAPWDCSAFGNGFPDVMVGSKAGTFILFEIKTDEQYRRKNHGLTESEWIFHQLYSDYPLYIIQTLDDALAILEAHHADTVHRPVVSS
jgi:hypothetical protein